MASSSKDTSPRRPTVIETMSNASERIEPTRPVVGTSTITVRQSIYPLCLVTILFFLWGFAYGLLDVLNAKFQTALNITAAKAGGLQGAYFGAYLVGPLTYSGWIVRRFGYRWTFITGLCIYGVGSLMFWPSAVYKSFAGFCGSLFIVGSGLSTLEASANPYIATCGPPRLSEFRLEISQAFQAIGSVAAPLLASKLFFKETNINDMSHVQWTYVGIAAFVFALAVVFYFSHIPEVTDADMETQAEESANLTGYAEKPMWKQYKLIFGVIAVFMNAGAQVSIASQFINYSMESTGMKHASASDGYAIAQALFAIGRFFAAGAFMYVRPRLVLLGFVVMIMVCTACAMGIYGEGGVAMLSLVLFFESCTFPTIFTLSIRGLGRHTKRGSSWLVAAVSGAALFPSLTGLLADHSSYHKAMGIPLLCFFFVLSFSGYVNTVSAKELDGFRHTSIGNTEEQPAKDAGDEASSDGAHTAKPQRILKEVV